MAGSPWVSENLVRASNDKETRGNFSELQAVRLEGILFHLILAAWDTARRAESDHPARSGRGPAANRGGVGARGPASPMGAGSQVQGEEKDRHALQRAMSAQMCQAGVVQGLRDEVCHRHRCFCHYAVTASSTSSPRKE